MGWTRSLGRGLVIAGLALVAGCTSSTNPPGPAQGTGAQGSSAPGSQSASPVSAPFLRTCDTSVYGDLGSDWRKGGLAAGPLTFVGLGSVGSAAADDFAPHAGRYRSIKALAVVDQGADVTVSIATADLGHAALIYDPSSIRDDGLYAVNDGESAVTFRSCAKGQKNALGYAGPTQFNGGFVVDGPRCLAVDVVASGRPPQRLVISMGRGRCPISG